VDISVELSSSLFSAAQRRQFQEGFRSLINHHDTHGQRGIGDLWDNIFPQVWNAWCAVLGYGIISSIRMVSAIKYLQLSRDPSTKSFYADNSLGVHLLTLFDPRISSAHPIEGRRLAKLASGRCSIVPASTCKEDIYVEGLEASWILRPLNPPERDQHLEAQIRDLLRHDLDPDQFGIMPIEHCMLVGQCWSRVYSGPLSSQQTIYAIH